MNSVRKSEIIEKLRSMNLNQAHYVDIVVRINGEDRRYEGDWLKEFLELLEVKR